jgi:mono/diheme cytochrome c family protein
MQTRIALGAVLFMLVIAVVGYVVLNEGLLPGQTGRMQKFDAQVQGRSIEAGALLFQNNCVGCHGVQGQGIPGVAPALNAADLFNGERLKKVGYSGKVADYIRGTVTAGRPVKTNPNYPNPMPTWGQVFGGPLRDDQINNLTDFIMNWKDQALAAAPQATPAAGGAAPGGQAVGTSLDMPLPQGNADNGQKLFASQGCAACHSLKPDEKLVGPSLAGIAMRAGDRIKAADYKAKATTGELYIRESIVQPGAYVIPGFPDGVMPQDFGKVKLSAQDLADLIAFLLTQK